MSEQLGRFILLNRHSGQFEDATLHRPIGRKHVRDFQTLWRPAFKKRLATIRSREEFAEAQMQDSHWEWPQKAAAMGARLDYDTFAVEAGGVTQGLMIVSLTERGRAPGQENDHLIYVELIAAAPWNRKGFTDRPKYKGVGRLLLAAAVSLSVDQEFGGRVGLHALPQSATWYRQVCGMTDLGPDEAHQRLHYFEMTETQARAFVGRTTERSTP
jgi:hypothetical protein